MLGIVSVVALTSVGFLTLHFVSSLPFVRRQVKKLLTGFAAGIWSLLPASERQPILKKDIEEILADRVTFSLIMENHDLAPEEIEAVSPSTSAETVTASAQAVLYAYRLSVLRAARARQVKWASFYAAGFFCALFLLLVAGLASSDLSVAWTIVAGCLAVLGILGLLREVRQAVRIAANTVVPEKYFRSLLVRAGLTGDNASQAMTAAGA